MIRLGALMSPDLVEDVVRELEHRAVLVIDLGAHSAALTSKHFDGLDAVVVELADTVLERDLRALTAVPVAGIPVSPLSENIASRYGIDRVLSGQADLEDFVGRLVEVEAPLQTTRGRIIAVWGPGGAPGRTTVALATAALPASRGRRTVLIDADTYAPSIAPLVGLTPAQPGVVSACRVARVDGVDSGALMAVSETYRRGGISFDVLTGLRNPAQFSDCPALAWSTVLTTLKGAGYLVVVDVGSPLQHFNHEVVGGPVRNAMAMATLEVADNVIVVARAEPLSLLRLSRSWPRVQGLSPTADVHTVFSALPAHSERELEESTQALWQFTGQEWAASIAYDRTLRHGSLDAEVVIASALTGVMSQGLGGVMETIEPGLGLLTPPRSSTPARGTSTAVRGLRWFRDSSKRLP